MKRIRAFLLQFRRVRELFGVLYGGSHVRHFAWFSTIQIVKNTHGGVLLLVKLHNFCIKYIDLLVKLHGEEGSEFFQFPFRHYQLLQYILIAFVLGKFCRNISKARTFFFFFFFFFWSSRKTTWLVSMWKGHWSLNGWTCKYYLQKPLKVHQSRFGNLSLSLSLYENYMLMILY